MASIPLGSASPLAAMCRVSPPCCDIAWLPLTSSRPSSGIQADLKTCEALGVFGTTAVFALTAQNTLGVHRVHSVPVDFVRAQIDAVLDDMGTHAVKTGMLLSEEVISEVAAALDAHGATVRVIDPVIVAASGDVLAGPVAVAAIKRLLIPTATVLTPNMPEAGALLNDRRQQI
eukprot:scaffold7622_cov130-Isochrysis_galbana.AAC.6